MGYRSKKAALGTDVFVVRDAKSDWRVADNHLVHGARHVRCYAGAPLRAPNGYISEPYASWISRRET